MAAVSVVGVVDTRSIQEPELDELGWFIGVVRGQAQTDILLAREQNVTMVFFIFACFSQIVKWKSDSSFLSVGLVGWQVGVDVEGPSGFRLGGITTAEERWIDRIARVGVVLDVLNQGAFSRLGFTQDENRILRLLLTAK